MKPHPLATMIAFAVPAFAHAAGGTICGTVYTEESRPAPNRLVFLYCDGVEAKQVSADMDGEFELREVAPGDSYVLSTGGPCAAFYSSAPFTVSEGKEVVINLGPKPALRGEGCLVRGKLRTKAPDADGNYYDAVILLDLDNDRGFSYRMAGVDGDRGFQFSDVQSGSYSIVVRSFAGGFVSHVEIPRQREYICDLVPAAGSITGVVRDARTRDPIKGALVIAWESGAPTTGTNAVLEAAGRSDETDKEGRYTIIGLSPGGFLVEAGVTDWNREEGRPSLTRETASCLVVEGKPATCDLALGPAVSLSVTVRDGKGSPVSYATARLDGWPLASPLSLASNDPGSLTINGLMPGQHVVTVSHPSFAPVRRHVRVGEKGGHEELVMTLGGSLTVTVVDRAGSTVDGASIEIVDKSGARVPTERGMWDMIVPPKRATIAGRFRVAHVAAGTYTVRATQVGTGSGSTPVTVTEGGDATVHIALQ